MPVDKVLSFSFVIMNVKKSFNENFDQEKLKTRQNKLLKEVGLK